jgi:hypothetical protein
MDGGTDPRIMNICKKVNKMLLKAYKNKEEAWPGKMRHRAIVWSCPAHYYANFSNWAANCWGINVLVEMESLNFTKHLETSDKEEAMRDLARLYERMVMRRHTNGGYQNVVDELWKQCEDWNVETRHHVPERGLQEHGHPAGHAGRPGRERGSAPHLDRARPYGSPYRFPPHMRDKVSNYMRTVMLESPWMRPWSTSKTTPACNICEKAI